MTEKEIIKGLECCNNNSVCVCLGCPLIYRHNNGCISYLTANALNLINRQKAEIEELTEKHHNECRQIAHYDNESTLFADLGKLYSEIRIEAVKKFAKALKAELKNLSKVHLFGATFALVGENFVDDFVEKYEGENNDT